MSRDLFATREGPPRLRAKERASHEDARRCARGAETERDSVKAMAKLVLYQRDLVMKLKARIKRARKTLVKS